MVCLVVYYREADKTIILFRLVSLEETYFKELSSLSSCPYTRALTDSLLSSPAAGTTVVRAINAFSVTGGNIIRQTNDSVLIFRSQVWVYHKADIFLVSSIP